MALTLALPTLVTYSQSSYFTGVGAFRNGIGGVQIIPNQDGELVIPSVIAFTNSGVLVGNPAKKQRQLNLKNTFYDVKRLIGRE